MTINLGSDMMNNKGEHAIVIGGSIAGCLAAEVLSRQFARVTVIEKGRFNDQTSERRGVPQEKHVHLLLLRGKQVMEQIFPGLLDELELSGAVVADLGHDVKWFQYGLWKQRYRSGVSAHYSSRRLIDNLLHRRIHANSKITVLANTVVKGLQINHHADRPNVTGVVVSEDGGTRSLDSSLVLDASGRGTRVADWIAAAGLGETVTTLIETRLGYASRVYRRRREYQDRWKVLLVLPKPPGQRRMGVISPIEGDRWLVTTGGWFDDFPKPMPDAFIEFLKELPVPDIYDVVKDAEPLSDVSGFRVPGSLRRHYERLERWPDGLIVMGDALCSLNPLYSQGMTLCGMEAECLAREIRKWLIVRNHTRHIQSCLAQVVQPAWDMAAGEDMRFSETAGERSILMRLRHWYGAGLARLSASNRLALQTQIGVTNLVVPPERLYRPEIATRILLNSLVKTKY